MKKTAHIYICGDVQMAADVTEKIEDILQNHGNISKENASNRMKELKVCSGLFCLNSFLYFFLLFFKGRITIS